MSNGAIAHGGGGAVGQSLASGMASMYRVTIFTGFIFAFIESINTQRKISKGLLSECSWCKQSSIFSISAVSILQHETVSKSMRKKKVMKRSLKFSSGVSRFSGDFADTNCLSNKAKVDVRCLMEQLDSMGWRRVDCIDFLNDYVKPADNDVCSHYTRTIYGFQDFLTDADVVATESGNVRAVAAWPKVDTQ